MSNYYLHRNSQQEGPYNIKQLQDMERSGDLRPEHLSWKQGMDQWQPASRIPGLFGAPVPGLSTNKKVLIVGGIGCGALLVMCLGLLVIAALFLSPSQPARDSTAPAYESVENVIRAKWELACNQEKQSIFDALHPVGTAKNIVVHEVTIDSWLHGAVTNREADVQKFTVRFTVYWEGPLEKNGFTKVTQTFDTEVGRYVSGRIEATNGITKSDVGEALGFIAGSLLGDALRGN